MHAPVQEFDRKRPRRILNNSDQREAARMNREREKLYSADFWVGVFTIRNANSLCRINIYLSRKNCSQGSDQWSCLLLLAPCPTPWLS